MYADYDFYKQVFKGVQFDDEVSFASAEVKAAAFVNKITFGRIGDEIADPVRMAACAVSEIMDGSTAAINGISNENNDGYSVSYSATSMAAVQKKAYETAKIYLPPELLYAGVDP